MGFNARFLLHIDSFRLGTLYLNIVGFSGGVGSFFGNDKKQDLPSFLC